MPVKANVNQFILGSNRNLRLITKNETDYSISEPLIHFDDPGYVIYSAHCDSNGTMFIRKKTRLIFFNTYNILQLTIFSTHRYN